MSTSPYIHSHPEENEVANKPTWTREKPNRDNTPNSDLYKSSNREMILTINLIINRSIRVKYRKSTSKLFKV